MITLESNSSNISKLQKLGLTEIQAKVYLTLTAVKKEKVSTIAKLSNINRSNVYQAIRQLEKKQIINRILGSPNLYYAIPLEEALESLIKTKSDQFSEILVEAESLKREYKENKKRVVLFDDGLDQVRLINTNKSSQLLDIIKIIEGLQKSINLLINNKQFFEGVLYLAESHLRSLDRGIKYRIITEFIDFKCIQKELNPFLKKPDFEIRFINNPPLIDINIIDNKNVGLTLFPNRGIGRSSFLTSNNIGLVEMALTYFDTIWNKAKKIKS